MSEGELSESNEEEDKEGIHNCFRKVSVGKGANEEKRRMGSLFLYVPPDALTS